MKTRAITGFFFVIVMLGSVLLGQYVFSAFYLLIGLLCQQEFYRLVTESGAKPNKIIGLINGTFVFVVFALQFYTDARTAHQLMALLIFPIALIFFLELYRTTSAPFTNIAFTILGLLFTIIPFSLFHAMAFLKGGYNFHFPLAFLLMLWTNDTGAYLSGRLLGKHKLWERHSPKKTWEGFVGGVVLAVVVSIVISHYFTEIGLLQWVVVATLIGCIGTLGDLVESMFKRSIDIKDSGGILPGHGGLLDRFDGLLLAAPLVFTFLYLYFA